MALGYALTWVIVWLPINLFFLFRADHNLLTAVHVLCPLQGLFNFIMFMLPKVRIAKRPRQSHELLNWFHAFTKALFSRGEKAKPINAIRFSRHHPIHVDSRPKRSMKIQFQEEDFPGIDESKDRGTASSTSFLHSSATKNTVSGRGLSWNGREWKESSTRNEIKRNHTTHPPENSTQQLNLGQDALDL